MAKSVLVDASFLVSILTRRDFHHEWAVRQAAENPPPWYTCDAALSEAFYLIGQQGAPSLKAMLLRRAVVADFNLNTSLDVVLKLLHKYSNVPMSLADACLVRMSEIVAEPVILTTDSDFLIYRRHSRQVIPCIVPA